MTKQAINVVWLKRDLRLEDHAPLKKAIESNLPCILLFLFEPMAQNHASWDIRHWQFQYHSILDMNSRLNALGKESVYAVHSDAIEAFTELNTIYSIQALYSHLETGIANTFERDKEIAEFCTSNQITWHEFQPFGVSRGLKNRQGWDKRWFGYMSSSLEHPNISELNIITPVPSRPLQLPASLIQKLDKYSNDYQPAGETYAKRYLSSFLLERHRNYAKHISKPLASRRSCSRLSAYIAWGNVSLRSVYQQCRDVLKENPKSRFNLSGFMSRLRWHCHFIQKFEMECRMENESVNKAYHDFPFQPNKELLSAWKNGSTGIPIIDACMRCLKQTGYLNFRMRAMLVSFLTHCLLQPWQDGVDYLASLFLDFEPGIHYPQFQMQTGLTGVNTIRIYNPIKQSIEQDEEGLFIKKWLPELEKIPATLIHQPWLLTPIEQKNYGCIISIEYPAPVIDVNLSLKKARELFWAFKSRKDVRKEGQRILKKHIRPGVKRNA